MCRVYIFTKSTDILSVPSNIALTVTFASIPGLLNLVADDGFTNTVPSTIWPTNNDVGLVTSNLDTWTSDSATYLRELLQTTRQENYVRYGVVWYAQKVRVRDIQVYILGIIQRHRVDGIKTGERDDFSPQGTSAKKFQHLLPPLIKNMSTESCHRILLHLSRQCLEHLLPSEVEQDVDRGRAESQAVDREDARIRYE